MKLTKEKIGPIDHRGNLIDFIFCSNCVTFESIAGKKEGDEIIGFKCRTDKYFL
jgi:hypothetical protein